MSRILIGAAVFGGCLLGTGCDTSPGSGNVGPAISVTKNFTAKEDTEKAKPKVAKPNIQGQTEPPKE